MKRNGRQFSLFLSQNWGSNEESEKHHGSSEKLADQIHDDNSSRDFIFQGPVGTNIIFVIF